MDAILKNLSLLPGDVPMIFIGMILFFIFCRIFGRKVVTPYIHLLETREAASEGALHEAEADRHAAEELRHAFEAKILEARTAATAEKLKTLDSAKKDAAKLIENAEAQARHIIESERAALSRTTQEARAVARGVEENLVEVLLKKLALIALLLLLPSTTFAAEGGAHHAKAGFIDLIPYWVNFLIYVGGLYYLLKDKAPQFWAERREGIARAIEGAAKELQISAAELRNARERFDNVEEEVQKIKEMIRKDAILEHDAILAEARKQCERAVERAHETVASERGQAEQSLRRELAEHVIANATRRLKEQVSSESDKARREGVLGDFKRMLSL